MEAKANRVVSIIYELRKDNANGEVVEILEKERPLTFIVGMGNLLPKFEAHLLGKKIGESFTISLSSEDAYGPVLESSVIDIPTDIFKIDGVIDSTLLQLGNIVPMMDREGRRLNGLVKKIGDENVTMDFNHPMAGTNLYFKGEVTDVREANHDELQHGHIHSESGCGDCNDGNCSSKQSSEDGCGCGCS